MVGKARLAPFSRRRVFFPYRQRARDPTRSISASKSAPLSLMQASRQSTTIQSSRSSCADKGVSASLILALTISCRHSKRRCGVTVGTLGPRESAPHVPIESDLPLGFRQVQGMVNFAPVCRPRHSSAKSNDHIEQGAGAAEAPQHERDDTEREGDDAG